jgi:hypothetical protein
MIFPFYCLDLNAGYRLDEVGQSPARVIEAGNRICGVKHGRAQ